MLKQATAQPRCLGPALRQRWLDRFDRFASSRLCVSAFCRRESVSVAAFYYWKRKLASLSSPPADADAPRLVPIHLLSAPSPVEVVLPSGSVLRLNPGCDLSFVQALVHALGGASC